VPALCLTSLTKLALTPQMYPHQALSQQMSMQSTSFLRLMVMLLETLMVIHWQHLQYTALWAGDLDRASLVQLCAAAIGVCYTNDKLPHYRPSQGKPLDYGFACLETLLADGWPPTLIYNKGSECLGLMASALPSESDVESAANFSKPPEED
jgi:hypothetical protein